MTVDQPSMNQFLNLCRNRAQRKAGVVGFLAVLLYVYAVTASAAELQKSGDFQGNWGAVGTTQSLALGETRYASIVRLRGTIVIKIHMDLRAPCRPIASAG